MATSDAPLNVPNVTLAVARPAGSGSSNGGTDALAYSAPNGLADGEELIVTTDNIEGWDFGAAPSELATFGFGQGLLYSAATGQTLQSHTDSHSGSSWEWARDDFHPSRQIAEEAGFRFIRVDNTDGGYWTFAASQFVPENEKIFISSMSRSDYDFVNDLIEEYEIASVSSTDITLTSPWADASYTDQGVTAAADPSNEDLGKYRFRATMTNGSATIAVTEGDPAANGVQAGWTIGRDRISQWKGLRISDTGGTGSDANSPGRNDFYTSPNNGTPAGWYTDQGAWKYTDPSLYGGVGDLFLREWIRVDHQFMTGNLDTANGSLYGNMLRLEDPNTPAVYNKSYRDDSVAFEVHGVNRRIGAFSWQDFTVGIRNQVLDRTDTMVQIGSLARFEIANSDDPSTTTAAHLLPPFLTDWSSGSAKVLLWKGLFSDYTGKYLHFYDSDGAFRKAVAL